MCDVFSRVTPANVVVSYIYSGLGFAGRPGRTGADRDRFTPEHHVSVFLFGWSDGLCQYHNSATHDHNHRRGSFVGRPFMRNQSVQPMQIYLFTGGVQSQELNELVKRLSEALPDLAIVSKLSDAPISPAHGPDPGKILIYIIVPFLNTASPLDRVISIAEQDHPGTFFIFVSKEISASEYKRLTKNGSADWVSLDGAPQEILDILSRRNSLTPAAACRRSASNQVIYHRFCAEWGRGGKYNSGARDGHSTEACQAKPSPTHLLSGPGRSDQPRLRLPGYRTAAEDGRDSPKIPIGLTISCSHYSSAATPAGSMFWPDPVIATQR